MCRRTDPSGHGRPPDLGMEERDEDAFAIAARIPHEIPKEPGTGFPLQPRWVVCEGLADHVQDTLTRLRTHVRYGDRRPLIVPDGPDSDITSRGTRREAREAERRRDPEEQKRERLQEALGPWLVRHRRPAWHPVCEEGDGPLTASRFAGTPWLAPGEPLADLRRLRPAARPVPAIEPVRAAGGAGRTVRRGLLQFFHCRHTASGGDCRSEGFKPFAECHLVHLVQPDARDDHPELPAEPGDVAPSMIIDWDRIDDYPRWNEVERFGLTFHISSSNREEWVECPEIGLISERFKPGSLDSWQPCDGGDKPSGWPCRIQDIEYPSCPRCQRPMQLVFQHTGDKLPFMFGDSGLGHITQCPEHLEVLAFGWACH